MQTGGGRDAGCQFTLCMLVEAQEAGPAELKHWSRPHKLLKSPPVHFDGTARRERAVAEPVANCSDQFAIRSVEEEAGGVESLLQFRDVDPATFMQPDLEGPEGSAALGIKALHLDQPCLLHACFFE